MVEMCLKQTRLTSFTPTRNMLNSAFCTLFRWSCIYSILSKCLFIIIYLVLIESSLVLASGTEATLTSLGPPVKGEFKSLTDELYATQVPLLTNTLSFSDYYQWKRRLSANYGVDFILLNTPIYQISSTTGENYWDNEMDLYFQWRLLENDCTNGHFFFWGLWVQTFSKLASGAYAASQGLSSFPNGGATDPNKSVVAPSALWWEQTIKPINLAYRIGQLYAPSLWGANDYLGDDRATFMNTVFGTNQGVPWANGSRGLGAMLTVGTENFYAAAGTQDTKGDQESIDANSFSDGKFMYLGELGVKLSFGKNDQGFYKVTAGYVDKTQSGNALDQKAGYGITVNGRHDLEDDFGFFGIVRHSYNRFVNNTQTAAAIGALWKKPLERSDDLLGLGGFYYKPHDTQKGTVREEYGCELFWKIQLTPRLDATPDFQLYLQPGDKNQKTPVTIFGLRLRYVL